MVKSKILKKVLFFSLLIISLFTFSIVYFVIPQINVVINDLEEVNAKQTLNNVVSIVNNVYEDMELVEKYSLETHKVHLKELTNTVWSVIETKYEESKPKNIGNILKERSKNFKVQLTEYYEKNKENMSEDELKEAIKSFIRGYRYDDNGYFFSIDFNSVVVVQPITPELVGKSFKNIKDKNGVYFTNEMVEVCKNEGSGFVEYIWEDPLTKQDTQKLSYVFKFEPYNWIIGTGEYRDTLKQQLKNEVITLLDKLRYRNGNYFFVVDYNNTLLSHPTLKGTDASNMKDIKGNLVIPEIIKLAREKHEGYYEYWLKKTINASRPYKKISFVKDFPNWKIVIGTGILLENVNKIIKERQRSLLEELDKIVNNTKIGKTGYLYVFDSDGNVLFHPNDNIKGKNFYDFKNPSTGNTIAHDLINASITADKTLKYKWDKPTDKENYTYEKVSWIKYLPKQKLYIASSMYIEDLENSSKELSVQIIIFAFVFIIIMLLISISFFNKLLYPLVKLSEHFLEAEKGNYSVRSNIKSDDEIGMVSQSFNKMVDKTEKLISNLEKFVDNQENIVILTDGKKLNFANKKMFKFFGYDNLEHFLSEHDTISEKFIQNDRFFYPEKIEKGDNWISKIKSLPPKERVVTMLGTDFNIYAFSVGINEFDENNLIVSFSDISENVIEQIRLEEQTIHDKLTNSFNREYFEKNYKKILLEYTNSGNHLAVAFLDIDYFKKVNDTYGHDVGDDVLVKFVKTIQKYSRQDDILIRWGGEEFILLLKISAKKDLKLILENLREKISQEPFPTVKNITCSIGGSIYKDNEDINTTIKRADICVYEAKASGRNKVFIDIE